MDIYKLIHTILHVTYNTKWSVSDLHSESYQMLYDQVEEEGHVKNIFSIGDSNQVDYLPLGSLLV